MKRADDAAARAALRVLTEGLEALGYQTKAERRPGGVLLFWQEGRPCGTLAVVPYRLRGRSFWRFALDHFVAFVFGRTVLPLAGRGLELTCQEAELPALAPWLLSVVVARDAKKADPASPVPIEWGLTVEGASPCYGWTREAKALCFGAMAS